jgi:DNA-binding HxlR family transcriptional regulator
VGNDGASTHGRRLDVPIAIHGGPAHLAERTESDLRRAARSDLDLIECIDQALTALHGKWKVYLLVFMARGIHRHSKLLGCLPGASKKIMTDTLRALERDGLVQRTVFAEVPVRVEYSLTQLGWTISEPLIALSEWGKEHAPEMAEARSRWHLRGTERYASERSLAA